MNFIQTNSIRDGLWRCSELWCGAAPEGPQSCEAAAPEGPWTVFMMELKRSSNGIMMVIYWTSACKLPHNLTLLEHSLFITCQMHKHTCMFLLQLYKVFVKKWNASAFITQISDSPLLINQWGFSLCWLAVWGNQMFCVQWQWNVDARVCVCLIWDSFSEASSNTEMWRFIWCQCFVP